MNTNPRSSNGVPAGGEQLRLALEHARRLSEPRPERSYDASWSALAAHVGDLAVLALALGG
jgi:hypothetical protein